MPETEQELLRVHMSKSTPKKIIDDVIPKIAIEEPLLKPFNDLPPILTQEKDLTEESEKRSSFTPKQKIEEDSLSRLQKLRYSLQKSK
jgi:hypothetical protein